MECKAALAAAASGIEARISSYGDQDTIQSQMLVLDISRLPDGFFADRQTSIQLIAWKSASSGGRQDRSPAVRLFFVSKDRGDVLRATPVDRISPNTMDAAIAMARLDPTQYNHDSFLRRFSLLVTGLEEEWQGLTLNIHRGNAIVTHLESRLPSHSTIAGALHDDEAAEHGRYRTLVDCGSS